MPNVMTSSAVTRASAAPSRFVNKAGSSPASRASLQRGGRRRRRAERRGLERALERIGEIERRIGDGGGGVEVDPAASDDQHRLVRQRLLLVGELQRRRPVAGDQQVRGPVAVESREPLRIGGLDREERDFADRHRPAAPEGVDRAGDVPRAAQSANSVISGTWSEGRIQARQGS